MLLFVWSLHLLFCTCTFTLCLWFFHWVLPFVPTSLRCIPEVTGVSTFFAVCVSSPEVEGHSVQDECLPGSLSCQDRLRTLMTLNLNKWLENHHLTQFYSSFLDVLFAFISVFNIESILSVYLGVW